MPDITITIGADHVDRVREAFATLLRKPIDDVTLADVQGFMVQKLKTYVRNVEKQAAVNAATQALADLDAT